MTRKAVDIASAKGYTVYMANTLTQAQTTARRTAYKPGDRVEVFNSSYKGLATVKSWPLTLDDFVNPTYLLHYDGAARNDLQATAHSTFELVQEPLEPATSPKEKVIGTLRVNVELVPDNIADAFIDKVADRVTAKLLNNAEAVQIRRTQSAPSRYVTATDKQSIKTALAAGKIVNAPKGSGKTTAILELLRENPGKYVAVYKDFPMECKARRKYLDLFGTFLNIHDTSNMLRKDGVYNPTGKILLYDDITDTGSSQMFAAVYTAP